MPVYFYFSFVGIFLFTLLSGLNSSELIPAVGMILILCLVYVNASTLMVIEERSFHSLIKFLFFFLLILGVISLVGRIAGVFLPSVGLTNTEILFIGENSMFALIFAPVAILYGQFFNNQQKILCTLFIFTVALPNATMFIFFSIYCVILLFYSSMSLKKKVLTFLSVLVFGFLLLTTMTDYLSSRLTINPTDMNLSSLIYLIHWIEVWDVITQLNFLGDGIGQSTSISQNNEYIISIINIYGDEMIDGSGVNAGHFYLSRLAVSIGYGFLFLLLLYIYSLVQSAILTKRYLQDAPLSLFFLSGFIPELLFRTPSLMSFGLFWLMLGFCSLQIEKTNIRLNYFGKYHDS